MVKRVRRSLPYPTGKKGIGLHPFVFFWYGKITPSPLFRSKEGIFFWYGKKGMGYEVWGKKYGVWGKKVVKKR